MKLKSKKEEYEAIAWEKKTSAIQAQRQHPSPVTPNQPIAKSSSPSPGSCVGGMDTMAGVLAPDFAKLIADAQLNFQKQLESATAVSNITSSASDPVVLVPEAVGTQEGAKSDENEESGVEDLKDEGSLFR